MIVTVTDFIFIGLACFAELDSDELYSAELSYAMPALLCLAEPGLRYALPSLLCYTELD